MIERFNSIEDVRKIVKEEVSRVSGVNLVDIDENLSWKDYYIDSIKMASLVDSICKKLNIELELADLYNSGNIKNTVLCLAKMLQ